MFKEIALDLRRYDTPEKLGSLVFDTASLAIEASDEAGIPRVNPHYFIKRGENYVGAPGKDKRDVADMFVPGDLGTKAAKEIRRRLIEDTSNFAYVWISAQDPWPEARIEIGAKKLTKSKRFDYIKAYGISTTLSPEGCLKLGQFLVSISPKDYEFPTSTKELRSQVIKLSVPEGQDPFEFLSKIIDLPEKNIFQSILDGSADKNKAGAIKAAVIATEPVRSNPQVIYLNPFVYGAYVEDRMEYLGFEMNPTKFGCGASNKSALDSTTTTANEYGFNTPTSTEGKFVKNCGSCGKPINAYISKGYTCSCGGVYEGC